MYQNEDWRLEAACRNTDPNIFVPAEGANDGIRVYKTAREFCANCPVTQECLDYAVRMQIKFGMWGGLTPKQRRPHLLAQMGASNGA